LIAVVREGFSEEYPRKVSQKVPVQGDAIALLEDPARKDLQTGLFA
jgi:hypothetical protein